MKLIHFGAVPTITDIAICVRHWDFSETSQTVCLFGREHGMIRGLAKGSKREKGKFSGGIDLLARGQVVAIVKPTGALATITDWNLLEIYWPLRERLEAHRAALFFADLLYRMVTDHDPHPALFDALAKALASLTNAANTERTMLRFLWSLLRETGYQPDLRGNDAAGAAADSGTLAFSPSAAGVVADTGASGRWRVRRETIELLRALEAGSLPEDSGRDSINRACRLLAAYLREILGDEPATMRLIFPDLMKPQMHTDSHT